MQQNLFHFYIKKTAQSLGRWRIPKSTWIIPTFFLLYLFSMYLMVRVAQNENFLTFPLFGILLKGAGVKGILAQLEAMILTYFVVSGLPHGFRYVILLSAITTFSAAFATFHGMGSNAAAGIFTGTGTFIIVSIIQLYYTRLQRGLQTLQQQNKTLQENEEKLHQLAFFDSLTKLPNRKMILEDLEKLAHQQNGKGFALMFFDLDNFKKINDSMGHQAGDNLLQALARRLTALVHPNDLLGCWGGDEFALLIRRDLGKKELQAYAELFRKRIAEPLSVESSEIQLQASFGIALFPQDSSSISDLIKYTDIAMSKAKTQYRNAILFFNPAMSEEVVKKMELENNLHRAIQQNELSLVFQPQRSTAGSQLRGFEVLARWESSRFGSISPVRFIPFAEESGLIIPLGEWVLRTACYKLQEMRKAGSSSLSLSVNISAVQIMAPSFLPLVKDLLRETEIPGNSLELEITETMLITSMDYVISILQQIRKLGIKVALDDFGTGYSSLSYLQKLPLDILKIDKSFIDRIGQNFPQQIVGSIVSLAHDLGLEVIAEGVETESQRNYLLQFSCDFIQGLLAGPLLSEEDVVHATDAEQTGEERQKRA
ncbi:MAG TPA: EAL domain-containing protein [Fibrobacteraceae bacterium]|nr:EAL domain-containing protein [Fibrobacteraceae bacterium]